MSTYDTALSIINDVALQLALTSETYSAIYSSVDANVVLLRNLLKAAGQDLERSHHWSQLETEYTFSTVNGTASYDLPVDFSRLIPRTAWNRTDRLREGGPLTAQRWQTLKGASLTSLVQQHFRVKGRTVYLYPTPTSAETVALEYLSSWWVWPDGDQAPSQSTPAADTDVICFDSRLVLARVKRDFLRAKGFDSTAASEDYERLLAVVLGGDGEAPVLDLGRGRGQALPEAVLPDTFTG